MQIKPIKPLAATKAPYNYVSKPITVGFDMGNETTILPDNGILRQFYFRGVMSCHAETAVLIYLETQKG